MSDNPLADILEVVVAPGSPVFVALQNDVVHEPLRLHVVKHFTGGEEPVFEVPDGLLASLEARQIILSQEHHLHDYNNFF